VDFHDELTRMPIIFLNDVIELIDAKRKTVIRECQIISNRSPLIRIRLVKRLIAMIKSEIQIVSAHPGG